jgi:hypothetical protein
MSGQDFEQWIDSRPGTSLRSGFDGSLDYPLGRLLRECWRAASAHTLEVSARVCDAVAESQGGDSGCAAKIRDLIEMDVTN